MESQVSRNAQADIPTVQKTRYGYDPFGRRLYKRDAFEVTRFAWDGNRLLSETRGSQVRTWVYETGTPDDGQAQKAHNVRYIHTDHLGTPRELTSGTGEIVWTGVHRAWGNLAIATMPVVQGAIATDQDTAAEGSVFTDAMPLRFQGQYYDSETGLHYNRFRYYDPDSGRFVSQDPIGLQGGNNLYQYAPNPSGWIDPLGLACTCKRSSYKGKLQSPASEMRPLQPGSIEWQSTIQEMQVAIKNGEKFQVKVPSSSDAKAFLKEAQGSMNRYKAHTQSARADGVPKYRKGYEQHMAPEGGFGDLPHIKYYNNGSDGHIFYDIPN